MKALVKQKPEPGLWLAEQPVPEIGPDDVLVKIHKTGICGTDIHIFNWDEWAQKTIPTPMTIGHEYGGAIAEVGANVRGLQASGSGCRARGTSSACAAGPRAAGATTSTPTRRGIGVNIPGAFANTCGFPRSTSCRCPTSVDDELGAILDPLGNAVHTALSFDLVGEDVLITGAGPIGIMAGRRRAPRRGAPRRDHRRQPEAPRARGRGRRRLPVDVSKEDLQDGDGPAADDRGLRRQRSR